MIVWFAVAVCSGAKLALKYKTDWQLVSVSVVHSSFIACCTGLWKLVYSGGESVG